MNKGFVLCLTSVYLPFSMIFLRGAIVKGFLKYSSFCVSEEASIYCFYQGR
jgi:hypothetical protein